MARLYEAALNGRMEAAKASRMVYILKEIRCAIESETLQGLEQRLAELTCNSGNRKWNEALGFWADAEETAAQAKARHLAEHPEHAGYNLIPIAWLPLSAPRAADAAAMDG
jgi:hypothetical protein